MEYHIYVFSYMPFRMCFAIPIDVGWMFRSLGGIYGLGSEIDVAREVDC